MTDQRVIHISSVGGMIPIALFADLIDGVDDPGIAGQGSEASGLVT